MLKPIPTAVLAVLMLSGAQAIAQTSPQADTACHRQSYRVQPHRTHTAAAAGHVRTRTAHVEREKHSVGDGSITTAIKTKLLVSSDTSARRIHVNTRNGVVTLTGVAYSKQERIRAGRVARSVHGVQRVDNRVVVQPS